MSNRSVSSADRAKGSFNIKNMKISVANNILICVFIVLALTMFFVLRVTEFTYSVYDRYIGTMSTYTCGIRGVEAVFGLNGDINLLSGFNIGVFLFALVAVAVIPLTLIRHATVRVIGACASLIAVGLSFFVTNFLISEMEGIVYYPTRGLMLVIVLLVLAACLAISNALISVGVKDDVTLEVKYTVLKNIKSKLAPDGGKKEGETKSSKSEGEYRNELSVDKTSVREKKTSANNVQTTSAEKSKSRKSTVIKKDKGT